MSGQVGTDPATGKLVEGGVQKQTEQAIKNIGTILESVGVTYADVVKATCFLADIQDFGAFNRNLQAVFHWETRQILFCCKGSAYGSASGN